jgi:hypothetical protein
MADSDKNIVITPFCGATSQPNIVFTGQGNDPITVRVLDGTTGTGLTAGGALSFEGSAGQLFSVVNRLGTGSIFSVNDISGIPSIDVDANGTIELAPFTGYVGIGLTLPTEKLDISGSLRVRNLAKFDSGISASDGMTLTGTLRVSVIQHPLGVGNMSIYNSPNARIYIGDADSAGQSTFLYLRDSTAEFQLSNPYGSILIGDPNSVESGSYISYNAEDAELNLSGGNSIVGVGRIVSDAYQLSSSGIKVLTGTTYQFIASDSGIVITHNNASGCTFTVPSGLAVGFSTTVIQLNSTGNVSFIPASGVTLNSYSGFTALSGQHASASLISYATNVYNLAGNLS